MFRKPIKLSLVVVLLGSGIVSTAAMLVIGGQSAAVAATKALTCPDSTTGVTDGSWSVVCTGQTTAESTVIITRATSSLLSLKLRSPNLATNVNASYSSTDASFSLTFGAASQIVDITVTSSSGAAPDGVSVKGSAYGVAGQQFVLDATH